MIGMVETVKWMRYKLAGRGEEGEEAMEDEEMEKKLRNANGGHCFALTAT